MVLLRNLLVILLCLLVACPSDIALSIDVNGELKNALLEKQSTPPTGYEGRIYYNTTSKLPEFYNGTAWTSLGSMAGLNTPGLVSNEIPQTTWSNLAENGKLNLTGTATFSNNKYWKVGRTVFFTTVISGLSVTSNAARTLWSGVAPLPTPNNDDQFHGSCRVLNVVSTTTVTAAIFDARSDSNNVWTAEWISNGTGAVSLICGGWYYH